ncbi:MAG: HEAT repeat domain-containing protein [Phycisphaerales bacterium]
MNALANLRVCGAWARGLGVLCVCACVVGGCAQPGTYKRGAAGLIDLMAPPPPEEAAKLARNPYSANDRYRGTTQLAGQVYGARPENVQIYMDNAGDADPGVRAAAVRALGLHGSADQAGLVARRLSDEDAAVRVEAARTLQRVHAPQVVPALIERLSADREGEAKVRYEAARALGQYREGRVVEALIGTLADDEFVVTGACAWSLRVLTGQDFSTDSRAWLAWYKSVKDPFEAGSGYTYPVFSRGKYVWEYIPFLPQPPNEAAGLPVGMSPSVQ